MMKIAIATGLVGMFLMLVGLTTAKSPNTLQGEWKLIAGEAEGKALPESELNEGRLLIQGDAYTVTLAGKGILTGTQQLDATKTPKTIDIQDGNGSNKGQICLGIYEIKGGDFHVAFAPPGSPRPTKFTTAPGSGQWMHVWKRVTQ